MTTGNNPSLKYSRQGLRKATKFVEGDHTGINPRQFYRSLKRSLEEIQEEGDFKYTTHGTQDRDLLIESEEVGGKTGRITGRLAATSDSRTIGDGVLEYKPYGPHGALGLVIGGLLFLTGLTTDVSIIFVGIILLLIGGYFYFKSDNGEFSIERVDTIRVLISGEVSERTIEEEGQTRTDIFANMSVIYAGDTLLAVSLKSLDDMGWTFRRAVRNQVDIWYNQLVDEENQVTIPTGFIAEVSAWSNRSLESDRSTILQRQQIINDNFDMRIEYSDILMNQLPNDVQDELSAHQESIMVELESLSDEMEVYVEREGLEQV